MITPISVIVILRCAVFKSGICKHGFSISIDVRHVRHTFLFTNNKTNTMCALKAICPTSRGMTACVFLEENVSSIRDMECILSQTPNGRKCCSQDCGPSKVADMGVERLQQNLVQWFSNEHTNLLSCINLNVENLHSAVHDKSKVSTPL